MAGLDVAHLNLLNTILIEVTFSVPCEDKQWVYQSQD